MVGRLRGLEGRPRRLGRDRARRRRRRDRRAPLRARASALFMDAVAPGLLLAQAIGRWGNWWNQELFGKPTDLPWGLEIDAGQPAGAVRRQTRPSTRRSSTSSLWDLLGVGAPAPGRPALPDPAAGAVRALRRALHVRPLLRGAAARRPGARDRPAAAERVGLDRPLRLARRRSSSGGSSCGRGRRRRARERAEAAADDGRPEGPRPARPLASRAMVVRELELDLDAFEGPFDLLLTLVLKEELSLAEVDVAGDRARVRRAPRRARRARPRRVRRVPRPRRGAARAEGARRSSRTRRPSSPSSSPRRRPRSSRGGSPSTGA